MTPSQKTDQLKEGLPFGKVKLGESATPSHAKKRLPEEKMVPKRKTSAMTRERDDGQNVKPKLHEKKNEKDKRGGRGDERK